MSFLGKLNQKRPKLAQLALKLGTRKVGGNMLGNAVRFVGDKFTGGMVSNILPPSTREQVAKQQAKLKAMGITADQLASASAGQAAASGKVQNAMNATAQIAAGIAYETPAGQEAVNKFTLTYISQWVKENMIAAGAIVAGIGFTIYRAFFYKKY